MSRALRLSYDTQIEMRLYLFVEFMICFVYLFFFSTKWRRSCAEFGNDLLVEIRRHFRLTLSSCLRRRVVPQRII